MILNAKKQREIEVWEYFSPKNVEWKERNDEDLIKFFEWSEHGKHKGYNPKDNLSYFQRLVEGKRWAGIHVHQLYEQGVLEGVIPYYTLLGGEDKKEIMPRNVVNFLKKEMFKGVDAEVIENCYQKVLNKWRI